MAQTKSSSSRKRSSAGSSPKRSTASGTRKSTTSRARKNAAQNGAVGTVTTLAKKAKTPLIAGGAAVAGLAGGAALKSVSSGRRKVLGISMPKPNGLLKSNGIKLDPDTLTKAAKSAGLWGRRVEHVATEIEHARKKVK